MRQRIAFFLTFICGIPTIGQVVITPSVPPAVSAGETVNFKANQRVTWSMAVGSRGIIDPATGVYTAPSSITAQQSYGGCQALPNNHILNTRIDSLPVNSNSSAWIDKASSGYVFYSPGFPVNYAKSSTPTQKLVHYYTPKNSGQFSVPGYPEVRVQSGYFAPTEKFDKHIFVISPGQCEFQEVYNLYSQGTNPKCLTCTAQSGLKYSNSTYDLPSNGAANAAGIYILPLILRLQEVEQALYTGGTINHALGVTLKNTVIGRSFIWPATAYADAWGVVPYGTRFRLQTGFDISRFSPTAQLLLTQLKQYGLLVVDGGSPWEIGVEYTKWPTVVQAAFAEIKAAVKPSDMEAVDESGLMISPRSGNTNRESETIIATSVDKPSQKAWVPVVLTGVSVNLPTDQVNIQVGAPAQQFTAYVGGTNNASVTWSANPAVGTLSSDGLYTPPESVSFAQATTVTATSVVDSSVSAQMTVTVFPAGTIRILLGSTTPYTDPEGNVWQASTGYDAGRIPTNGWVGPTPPAIHLYRTELFASADMRFDFILPNGTYEVTGKFASTNAKVPGLFSFHIESQGRVMHRDIDLFEAAGGEYKPIDFKAPAAVKDNHLSYVLRHVNGENLSIAAIQIERVKTTLESTVPLPPFGVTAIVTELKDQKR